MLSQRRINAAIAKGYNVAFKMIFDYVIDELKDAAALMDAGEYKKARRRLG